MRNRIRDVVVPVLLGALVTVCAVVPPVAAAEPGRTSGIGADQSVQRKALRSHPLRSLEGGTLALGALEGEVVVINFWASWCKPCRKELPALDALHADISKKGGRVLAVSIDQEARNAERFVKAFKLRLPVYHDGPLGLAHTLELKHIPFTMVLNRRGDVAYTTSGTDEEALAQLKSVTRQLLRDERYSLNTDDADAPWRVK